MQTIFPMHYGAFVIILIRKEILIFVNNQLTTHDSYTACIGFDGTRKTKEFDDFNRDWPNIIVADNTTIMAVDAKWNDLGIGNFISSPSLKFKDQVYGEEAVVSESIQSIKV